MPPARHCSSRSNRARPPTCSSPPTWNGWTTVRRKSRSRPTPRINLLGNKLVLIAPKDSKIGNVTIGQGFDLAKLAGDGRIATGDVKAVPVGHYAKAALEKLGSWQAAEPKFAMADNVRAALLLVARGEATLGIVYETDAKVEPGVKIIGAFPRRFASADHLSGRSDRPPQSGDGHRLSRIPALGTPRRTHLREIRLHVS